MGKKYKPQLSAKLKNSNINYFGLETSIHNDASFADFYTNKKIDLGTRILIHFVYLWSLPGNRNKKPEERIKGQNPKLLKKLGYDIDGLDFDSKEYRNKLSAVQSTLARYEKEGFWSRKFLIESTGEMFDKENAHGLTCRRIVLDVNKVKTVLAALPEHRDSLGFNKRSRNMRIISRRPVTLKTHLINQIIKTQVADFKADQAEKSINHYLMNQYAKYSDFSGVMIEPNGLSDLQVEAIKVLNALIYDDDPNLTLGLNWSINTTN